MLIGLYDLDRSARRRMFCPTCRDPLMIYLHESDGRSSTGCSTGTFILRAYWTTTAERLPGIRRSGKDCRKEPDLLEWHRRTFS